MNQLHKRRLIYLSLFMLSLTLAVSLILFALKQNINVFFTPSELMSLSTATDKTVRLGGMVKPGSVRRDSNNLSVHFIVTDLKHETNVTYTGVLPDLFRPGKGVVVEGKLNHGIFMASMVLAKHDENYMPPQKRPFPAQSLTDKRVA